MSQTDLALIAGLKNRAPFAYKEISDKFSPSLLFHASKMVRNKEEAKDLVKNSFVKLWEKPNDFNSMESIGAFLYVALYHNCLNYKRKLKAHSRYRKEVEFKNEAYEDSYLKEWFRTELLNALTEGAVKLPDQCKKVYQMIFVEGLKPKEIANRLAITRFNVGVQKRLALQALRKYVKAKHGLDFDLDKIIILILLCNIP